MVLTREGIGLWVVVVGARVMEVGVEADDDIGHHRLGAGDMGGVGVVDDGRHRWVSSLPWW